jgi:glycerophosphoryl diester phosphodiesterase
MLSSYNLKYKPIAHRANGDGKSPENSLAAVRAAHALGIEWVECDVLLTKDKFLIVLHDEELKRTTTAQGKDAIKSISELMYAEIIRFDLTNESSEPFEGEKIPTLAQFLQLIKELNMGLLLEIKAVKGFERLTAQKTVEVLEQCGFDNYPKLIAQSFLVECLHEVKLRNSKIPRVILLEEWEGLTRVPTGNVLRYPALQIYACQTPIEEIISDLECIGLAMYHANLDEQRILYIKQQLALPLLLTWTVNNPERALELYRLGVDSVISDNCTLILQQLKQMEKISKELGQFKMTKQTIDIVTNYLGLFSYSATQKSSNLEPLQLPAKRKASFL